MSDPMTNLEIQDVLSSIRRLVSEDNRHTPEVKAEPAASSDADEKPDTPVADKLVLTKALRIDPAEDRQSDADDSLSQNIAGDGHFEDGVAVPDMDFGSDEGDFPIAWAKSDAAGVREKQASGSLEDTIAELEAAVAGIGEEFEPDGSELKGVAIEADAELDEAFEDGFGVDEAATDDDDELAQPVTAGGVGAASDENARPFASAPEVETTDAPSAPDDEPDMTVEDAAVPAPEVDDPSAEDVVDADADQDVAAAAQAVEDVPSDDVGAADALVFLSRGRSQGAHVTEEVNPTRRLNLGSADRVKPEADAPWDHSDDVEDADISANDLISEDVALEAGEPGPGIFDAAMDEAVLDMDMLRDLVAEIIREELQGPLGERITRNVRMLVRREINRMLESRDLD
ncbi:MAG: hypothetical protein WBC95_09905 [Albidovulum sp.]